ncbi:MAG: hypothetical protein Q4G70_09565 [Pseudomonadota bacterium]|nr:hypothetical protein [Pseudomonadota bacterium]
MMGWWIIISRLNVQEYERADKETHRAAVLAQWEVGVNGLHWLDRLINEHKAVQLSFNGYPNRYTALAEDIFPLLKNAGIQPPREGLTIIGLDEGEEYVQPPGWIGDIEMHADRMATCPSDLMLTIDAWDQS